MYKQASTFQNGGHAAGRPTRREANISQAEFIARQLVVPKPKRGLDQLEDLRRAKAKISLRKFSFDESEHAYRNAERKL